MTIYDLLAKKPCRIEYGNRWLINEIGDWIVYEHKRYARNSQIIITTTDEDKAIRALLGNDYED